METKRELLNHFKKLQEGIRQIGAQAFLNLDNFKVEVTAGHRSYVLYPQFVSKQKGQAVYAHQLAPDAVRFSGWRPYFIRQTPVLGKKLEFKAFVLHHGLDTPPFGQEPSDRSGVLVKKNISSFGQEISGPHKRAADKLINVESGEFYESFIEGRVLKIWYLRDSPICLEIKDMPQVIGDGKLSIQALSQKMCFRKKDLNPITWDMVTGFLSFFGKSLDTVPAVGERVLIDFRYTSPFLRPEDTEEVCSIEDRVRWASLIKLGEAVHKALPAEWEGDAVYTVDAIQSPDGRLWFLEVNFNPFVHPALYPPMLAGLSHSASYKELRMVPAGGLA